MTKRPNRRKVLQVAGGVAAAAWSRSLAAAAEATSGKAANERPRLRAASAEFAVHVQAGGPTPYTGRFTDAKVRTVAGPLKGTVSMPFEPFQGIGRQIRAESPLPLAIPCGHTNNRYGYLTDGPNTGGREYMSAFYRYTKFRPPYQKPAGDVLAKRATEVFRRFTKGFIGHRSATTR